MGARNLAESRKVDLEWASVWTAKCKEFQWKIMRNFVDPQKVDLERASVWTARYKEFQ